MSNSTKTSFGDSYTTILAQRTARNGLRRIHRELLLILKDGEPRDLERLTKDYAAAFGVDAALIHGRVRAGISELRLLGLVFRELLPGKYRRRAVYSVPGVA